VPVHLETVRAQELILTRERTRELEVSNRALATMSVTDGLTGIANRRRFDDMLAAEWSRARRGRQAADVGMMI
jgi:PleD family two-component response regulator